MTDRIEKEVRLKAPPAEVWKALANAETFGQWFGVALQGQQFKVGSPTRGHITYPGYEHLKFDVQVERIEQEHLLAFRWHPYAVDPAVDYSQEPTTHVVFQLQELADGTLLRVVESGFEKIPAARRDEAFKMNSNGWNEQMKNIQKYLKG
ncbi:SRPBCC family protein [Pseudomonas sp. LS1212]|uniref:SRPBCC family protein n=1 Tax=Pseudomonas sp. LS1212 TaxID=2972478 RepID=UPI0038CDB62A